MGDAPPSPRLHGRRASVATPPWATRLSLPLPDSPPSPRIHGRHASVTAPLLFGPRLRCRASMGDLPDSAAATARSVPVSEDATATLIDASSRDRSSSLDMAYAQHGRNALRQIVQNKTFQNLDGIMNPMLYASQGIRFRKLDVILTTNVDKLGKAGETVKVAPGYFRNHLMPKLLAVPNIDKYAYLIREQRKIYQPEEVEEIKVVKETVEDKMKEYHAAAKRLDRAALVLRRYINVQQMRSRGSKEEPIELREPVTKDELVAEVARQLCVQIDPENLHLASTMSNLGEYELPLRFPKSIPLPEGKLGWTLKVKIRSA